MKKIYVGIDISKEKCNLCFRSGLEIVREEIQFSAKIVKFADNLFTKRCFHVIQFL